MSQDSRGEYEVTCICSQTTRSNTVEFTCSKCGRQIELRWPAEYRPSHGSEAKAQTDSDELSRW